MCGKPENQRAHADVDDDGSDGTHRDTDMERDALRGVSKLPACLYKRPRLHKYYAAPTCRSSSRMKYYYNILRIEAGAKLMAFLCVLRFVCAFKLSRFVAVP